MNNNERTSVTISKLTKNKLARLQSFGVLKDGKRMNLGQLIDKLVEEKLNRIK